MDIKEKVKGFPDSPGVYLIKAQSGRILYVGKASSLRKRAGSYFQKPPGEKIQALLKRAADIEYIQTSSPAQALLLENSLIKKYKPYYNAALKDDKSYPYVKVSIADDYPYLSIVRGKKEKEARYFGPYTNVKVLKTAIKALRKIFPFRSCKRFHRKPCLYFHLKLCPGMCVRKIANGAYRENLRQLGLFLEGRHKELISELSKRMYRAANNELFEEAAFLRDRISSLTEIITQTRETKRSPAFARDDSKNGKYVESQDLILALKKVLKLSRTPYLIEAFDISEIGGTGSSGSMVSFLGGWPDKKHYRKFRIKTVQGIDDYAMIRELLRRRYGRRARKISPPLPDLVLIDGGKGHLSSAQKELKKLGLVKLPVIALAKRLETIYSPSGEAINLPGDSKLLQLLQRIRDEAHRFAITYHHKLREKGVHKSSLDEIPGVGLKRKQELLRHFRSFKEIKKASLEELLKVKSIDRKAAKNVLQFFSKKGF